MRRYSLDQFHFVAESFGALAHHERVWRGCSDGLGFVARRVCLNWATTDLQEIFLLGL